MYDLIKYWFYVIVCVFVRIKSSFKKSALILLTLDLQYFLTFSKASHFPKLNYFSLREEERPIEYRKKKSYLKINFLLKYAF